jgi:hypothetical protein
MRNSGTLLTFNRTGLRFAFCLGSTQPSPVFSIGISAEGPAVVVSTPSVRHYAAERVSKSTGSRTEREIKSKGLNNLHYSGRDTQDICTGNQPPRPAGQSQHDRDRRPQVCIAKGSREFQTGRRWKAEAVRKERNPPTKIKLGHYRLIKLRK